MNIPVTEWMSCSNKQPDIPGWYDASYDGVIEHWHRFYWSGKSWLYKKKGGKSSFGNINHAPNSWRGLTSPHPEWKP